MKSISKKIMAVIVFSSLIYGSEAFGAFKSNGDSFFKREQQALANGIDYLLDAVRRVRANQDIKINSVVYAPGHALDLLREESETIDSMSGHLFSDKMRRSCALAKCIIRHVERDNAAGLLRNYVLPEQKTIVPASVPGHVGGGSARKRKNCTQTQEDCKKEKHADCSIKTIQGASNRLVALRVGLEDLRCRITEDKDMRLLEEHQQKFDKFKKENELINDKMDDVNISEDGVVGLFDLFNQTQELLVAVRKLLEEQATVVTLYITMSMFGGFSLNEKAQA